VGAAAVVDFATAAAAAAVVAAVAVAIAGRIQSHGRDGYACHPFSLFLILADAAAAAALLARHSACKL
jgi:hypothetical protein